MNNINQKTPEGWSVKKISDLGNVVSGGTPDTNNPEYWDGNVLWVTPSEVSTLSNRFISNTERKITEKGLKESSAKLLPINSLIICTRATIGDCCINKVPMCTNQGFKNIIVKNNNVDFLYYLITKNKNELIRKACGSTFLEISKKDIDNLKFAIPPLPEQEKIALVLGTWDEAIEKLSNLIEQKKLLKKGLMQKLLTGKVRLPGFTQPWKEVKLGDFLKEHTEKTTENDQYQVLSVTKNGICSQEEYFEKQIASENNIGYKILRKHDIVFSPMNLWMGSIGFSEYDIGIVSPAYKIFSVNENVALFSFLKHFMIINRMIYLYLINSEQGASIVRRNLDLDGLLSSKVSIPDITEQQAIANVLSTADDEIDLLNKKLILFKEQKKGLMQQLLTGNIRVKVN
ncbi:MAG: restriction endonuclease subunit S [Alphaproteobacteria bacterium]|nr:restriction endonuclease subunit S [Alphaproteobacteria bacterium]